MLSALNTVKMSGDIRGHESCIASSVPGLQDELHKTVNECTKALLEREERTKCCALPYQLLAERVDAAAGPADAATDCILAAAGALRIGRDSGAGDPDGHGELHEIFVARQAQHAVL